MKHHGGHRNRGPRDGGEEHGPVEEHQAAGGTSDAQIFSKQLQVFQFARSSAPQKK
jgi:hypothetical protein